jgi:FkbH-like protein
MPVTLIREHRDTCDGLELARFLAGLGVEVAIERMSSSDEQAVIDLVRHTTHFINVLDRKWDRKLLSEFAAEGEAWTVQVRDRFGNYGISGAVTFAVEADVMRVGLLFLTCPVLGKQVEHALFAWIAQTAAERGARVVDIEFVRGRDNEGLCTLLSSLEENAGADIAQGTPKRFRLPVAGMEERIMGKAVNPEAVSQILAAMGAGSAA